MDALVPSGKVPVTVAVMTPDVPTVAEVETVTSCVNPVESLASFANVQKPLESLQLVVNPALGAVEPAGVKTA